MPQQYDREIGRQLQKIPNVGPATARDLLRLGIASADGLAQQDPDELHERLCQIAFAQAVRAGAASLVEPQTKPWGQTVAYVRDPDGNLIELASPMAPDETGPRHLLTILAVEDIERSVRFYRGVFGWSARVEVPVYVEFEFPSGCGLGVYQRDAFAKNPGHQPAAIPKGAISATEIYLYQEDLDAAIAKLEAAGARKLSDRAPRPWGDEAAYYADPDGNVVVVARPLPASEQEKSE